MSQYKMAKTLARLLHHGQKDKAGNDYINHVFRVAEKIEMNGGTYGEATIAYLHDLIEDTHCTLSDLKDLGFSEYVVEAVEILTRHNGEETYTAYIQRIKNSDNNTARKVKIADIKDHLEQHFTNGALTDSMIKRYETALKVLQS